MQNVTHLEAVREQELVSYNFKALVESKGEDEREWVGNALACSA